MEQVTDHKLAEKENKGALDRTMQLLVRNAFEFTVTVMCFVHALLFVVFLASEVMPLVLYNFVSVVIYTVCYFLCKTRHILVVYASIILEVIVYSVVSTYYVGLRCGTFFFLFSIIPIIIYFGSHLFKGSQRHGVILMLILDFTTFAVMYYCFADITPVYVVSPFIKMILVIFSAFAMVFAVMFYYAIYIYSSENEVTNLEQKNRKLSADAQEDALTSLLNRRGFLPVIWKLMNDEKHNHFCVSFCDLDNFKKVNDTFGHDAGDEVLKHVTLLIKKEMKGCDICRWGGEEIVILMKDMRIDEAKERMETLRRNIEAEPTVFFNKHIPITVTIGLAENKEKFNAPEEIIKVADARMYYGKQNGKNILIYDDEQKVER
ncbi:MAG: GGDEF domain-containing protein [Saccharofermentans sp.]|nr:GGDEF domain-containing protein [Saccharofermentans sp.]